LKVIRALLELIMLVPVKLTGLGNTRGLAPVTVMLFPIWMRFALVKRISVKGAVLPVAAERVIFPPVPARSVKAVAPFREPEKLMLAPAGVPPASVVSIVGLLEIATGPAIVTMPPQVVILLGTLIAVEPV
jgi:hypothetical protein